MEKNLVNLYKYRVFLWIPKLILRSIPRLSGFTIEKPHNFKEVPVFESTTIDAIDTNSNSSSVSNATMAGPSQQQQLQSCPKSNNEAITTHLFVPNLTKVSHLNIFSFILSCFSLLHSLLFHDIFSKSNIPRKFNTRNIMFECAYESNVFSLKHITLHWIKSCVMRWVLYGPWRNNIMIFRKRESDVYGICSFGPLQLYFA